MSHACPGSLAHERGRQRNAIDPATLRNIVNSAEASSFKRGGKVTWASVVIGTN
jgi:hypothetical protein